jgi:hypothetical protein
MNIKINKQIGIVLLVLTFIFSFFVGYKQVANEKQSGLSPIFEGSLALLNKNQDISSSPANRSGASSSNEPKTEVCPMNGQLFSKTQRQLWEKRRPLGIMVENHREARPQSGLSTADIVYEVVAEGGITRFLLIYYCQDASHIGPVRSARIYFIKLLQEYGDYPLYAHVGGANTPGPADALGEIVDLGWSGYNDLNQFSVPFPYFWRDYERLPNRATEHTVYTSSSKLWQYAAEKRGLTNMDKEGAKWDENFMTWTFEDDAKTEGRGNIKDISFDFWESKDGTYAVKWQYDKVTNSFKRFNGGSPHLDKNTGAQVAAKNVVIVFAKESPANDGYPGGHLLYGVVGQANGIIFQNGQATKVDWVKKTAESRMRFYDKKGNEVSFVRGPIWIEILPTGNEVNY